MPPFFLNRECLKQLVPDYFKCRIKFSQHTEFFLSGLELVGCQKANIVPWLLEPGHTVCHIVDVSTFKSVCHMSSSMVFITFFVSHLRQNSCSSCHNTKRERDSFCLHFFCQLSFGIIMFHLWNQSKGRLNREAVHYSTADNMATPIQHLLLMRLQIKCLRDILAEAELFYDV